MNLDLHARKHTSSARLDSAADRRGRIAQGIREVLLLRTCTIRQIQQDLSGFPKSSVAEVLLCLRHNGTVRGAGRAASTGRGPGAQVFELAIDPQIPDQADPPPAPDPVARERDRQAGEIARQRESLYWKIQCYAGLTVVDYAEMLRGGGIRIVDPWRRRVDELLEAGRIRLDGDRLFVVEVSRG